MKTEIDELPLESKKEKSQQLKLDNPGKLPIILLRGKTAN